MIGHIDVPLGSLLHSGDTWPLNSQWTWRLTLPTAGAPTPLSATHSYTPAICRLTREMVIRAPADVSSPLGSRPAWRHVQIGVSCVRGQLDWAPLKRVYKRVAGLYTILKCRKTLR